MPVLVHDHHDLLDERGRRGNVEAATELDHAVDERPWCAAGACTELVPYGDEGRVGVLRLTEAHDEVETRGEDGKNDPLVRVAARQGVRHHVRRARFVLDGEVEAQQLPHPVVLGNRGETLIQQVLEAVMIRLDEESAAPEVRSPVPYDVDEADELPLIGGEGAMAWRDGVARWGG